MTAPTTAPLDLARRWVSDGVTRLFEIELANEESMRREAMSKGRDDAMPPATTISTVIDSLAQGLACDEDTEEPVTALVNLLLIRDYVPGDTEVRALL